jgi:hypothetical protein
MLSVARPVAQDYAPETDLLLKDGYDVRALPNTLRGLEADAAVVTTYLKTVSGPVVLVGHQEELPSAPPPPADFTIAVPFTTLQHAGISCGRERTGNIGPCLLGNSPTALGRLFQTNFALLESRSSTKISLRPPIFANHARIHNLFSLSFCKISNAKFGRMPLRERGTF